MESWLQSVEANRDIRYLLPTYGLPPLLELLPELLSGQLIDIADGRNPPDKETQRALVYRGHETEKALVDAVFEQIQREHELTAEQLRTVRQAYMFASLAFATSDEPKNQLRRTGDRFGVHLARCMADMSAALALLRQSGNGFIKELVSNEWVVTALVFAAWHDNFEDLPSESVQYDAQDDKLQIAIRLPGGPGQAAYAYDQWRIQADELDFIDQRWSRGAFRVELPIAKRHGDVLHHMLMALTEPTDAEYAAYSQNKENASEHRFVIKYLRDAVAKQARRAAKHDPESGPLFSLEELEREAFKYARVLVRMESIRQDESDLTPQERQMALVLVALLKGIDRVDNFKMYFWTPFYQKDESNGKPSYERRLAQKSVETLIFFRVFVARMRELFRLYPNSRWDSMPIAFAHLLYGTEAGMFPQQANPLWMAVKALAGRPWSEVCGLELIQKLQQSN